MKSLVTGGAGFIGSHLCEKLIQEGHDVTAIDNLSVGRLSNISHLMNYPNFKFLKLDITSESDMDRLDPNYEQIFHLAALADIVPSIEMPDKYVLTNVMGTLRVLELARKCRSVKFLYSASSSCYGIPNQIPTPESENINCEYPYALSKFLGELMVLHWAKVYGISAISLRLFNVYGPRARTNGTYGAVFGVFLGQKLAGKPFTVVGDGSQTRDFTYVSDVVEAFMCASKSKYNCDVFNVGSGGTYSINDLVNLLGGETIQIPKRPGEPDVTFANIDKIRSLLGWKPQISFEDGVNLILQSAHLWKDAPVWDPISIESATQSWFRFLGDSKNG